MIDNQIQKRIMQRVRIIFFIRRLTSPLVLQSALFVASATTGYFLISLRDVYKNAPNPIHVKESFVFVTSAFLETEIIVQVAMVGIMTASMLLSSKGLKNIYLAIFSKQNSRFITQEVTS